MKVAKVRVVLLLVLLFPLVSASQEKTPPKEQRHALATISFVDWLASDRRLFTPEAVVSAAEVDVSIYSGDLAARLRSELRRDLKCGVKDPLPHDELRLVVRITGKPGAAPEIYTASLVQTKSLADGCLKRTDKDFAAVISRLLFWSDPFSQGPPPGSKKPTSK